MAKIYISHSSQDKPEAKKLAALLEAAGHHIFIDSATLHPGDDWRATLARALKQSDIIVVLLTEWSEQSRWVTSEIGAARAYQETREDVKLIPVVLGNAPIPDVLADLQAIVVRDGDIGVVAETIIRAIDRYMGEKAAIEVAREERREIIASNADDYITHAMTSLEQRQNRHRFLGNVWYIAGFIALIAGIVLTLLLSREAVTNLSTANEHWSLFAFLALKSLVVIGLLIASSKYAFSLGKSYMNEALKNSDRMHAISFGRFYLNAYGDRATWAEIKEVFQHWNIAKDSSFATGDSKEFDPNFIGAVLEAAKVLSATQRPK